MWYEINVSQKIPGKSGYTHIFATAKRSIPDMVRLAKVYVLMLEKFPESEGYNVSCTEMHETGTQLSGIQLARLAKAGAKG